MVSRILAAQAAEREYLAEVEARRRAESIRVWDHPGAVAGPGVNHDERVRRMVEAAMSVR